MAKRLSKPVRFMIFGTLGLLLVLLGFAVYLMATEKPPPVIVNPRVWSRVATGDRIEVNGYTFEMPIDAVYSRLDGSYGPDLEGALLVREDASDGSEIVVGRISRLTPETTIHPDRFGKLFLTLTEETRSRGDDRRLMTFKGRLPELPDRVLGLCLPADAYLFSDGITFNLGHMTAIMESWEPVGAEESAITD